MRRFIGRFWPSLLVIAPALIAIALLSRLDQVREKYQRVRSYSTLNEVQADLGKPDYVWASRPDCWAGWRYGEQTIIVEYNPADERISMVRLSVGRPRFSLQKVLSWLGL